MNVDQFAQRIHDTRDRLDALRQRAATGALDQELLTEALGELDRAVAELQAAETELRRQHAHPDARRTHEAEEQSRQIARLQVLADASRTFAGASLDAPVVLDTIVWYIADRMGGACVIHLLSDDRQLLEPAAVYHPDPQASAPLRELLAAPLPADEGLLGHVARTGQPLLIPSVGPDVYRAMAGAQDTARPDGFEVHSLLIVPLRVQGQAIGTLLVARDAPGHPYTADDPSLLQALADRAALAMNHARLYREVRQQHERLRVTLSSIGDAVIVTDDQGYVTFINEGAQSLTGWAQEDAVGKQLGQVFRIIDATTRLPVESPAARVMREGTVVGLANHTVLLVKDGAERPIDDSGAPIRDNQGNIVGIVLVFRDISERKRAEDVLARYQLLSEHARDIILFIREDGRIVEANSAAVEAYGYDRATLLSMSIYDLRAIETQGVIAAQMRRADTDGILFETIHRHKDGRTFPVEVSSLGAIVGQERLLLSIIRDITERKRAEAAQRFLAEASAVLASSLDYETTLQNVARLAVPTIADWCAVDMLQAEDGSIERLAVAHVDPAKEGWVHELQRRYPPDPDAPHGVPQALRSGRPEFYPEITEAMLEAGARDADHLRMMREIGATSTMIVPLVAREQALGALILVSAESGRRYRPDDLALAEELAHRAAIAVDNARLYRETQAAVQARDQFLSIASHELKTPLTSLLGYAQLFHRRATREGTLSERDERALHVIVEQAGRLNRMVAALLDLSRIEMGQLRIERAPVDLGALASRVLEEAWMATELHTLQFRQPDEPLIIEGDELRLEQVLQNLIGNAIKYSPAGGIVRVQFERQGDLACVSVSDQGIGIPQEVLPQLFQRFYRAPNVNPQHISGMGIGLYVVREIVALHGGTVEVSSTEGAGSTFTICLPSETNARTGS